MDWRQFETILLDMDGTVLDLGFDNYFWRELVPEVYSRAQDITVSAARAHIYQLYAGREGTLEWYCLDFWSASLQLDLVSLKQGVRERIRFLPGAEKFLAAVTANGQQLILVTNAHPDTLAVKHAATGLGRWFDECICSHDFGVPKERQEFWRQLQEHLGFARARTLFVDDSLPVLNAARTFGLGGVLAISKPVIGHPSKDTEDHYAVDSIGSLTDC